MNYFKVQARLIINFNSNIVEPNTRLDDHLVITTIFFRFKRRNKTYFNFYLFENHPLKRPPHFYDWDFMAQRWSHQRSSTVINCFMTLV